MSQPTQCAYIGLARGFAPSTPAQRDGIAAPGRPAAEAEVVLSRAGWIMTVRRFASTMPLRSGCHPAVRLVKPRQRLLHFVPALAGDEPAGGADSGGCGRTLASGP